MAGFEIRDSLTKHKRLLKVAAMISTQIFIYRTNTNVGIVDRETVFGNPFRFSRWNSSCQLCNSSYHFSWGTRAMRRRQFYSANGFVSGNRATGGADKLQPAYLDPSTRPLPSVVVSFGRIAKRVPMQVRRSRPQSRCVLLVDSLPASDFVGFSRATGGIDEEEGEMQTNGCGSVVRLKPIRVKYISQSYPNPYPKIRISENSDRDTDTKIYYPIFRISEFPDIRVCDVANNVT
ncbi:hypothetical protein LXL04_021379 [Taraxacum kok-saghyz]